VWGREPDQEWAEKLAEARGSVLAYAVCFGLLFCGVMLLFWWSRTTVDFSAARVMQSNVATYAVTGVVRDARSGEPVPWARIQDDGSGTPPFFNAESSLDGSYTLLTVPLIHHIRVSAQGYRTATLRVGRSWYEWWPRGSEHVDVRLMPE
jgi:hypothetical protein